MEFIDPKIEEYALKYSSPEKDILKKLNRETHAKVLMPRMLSGHMQGGLLSMVSHMLQPTRILEVGTYTGYSAICLAHGLKPGGMLHTIDINAERESMIRTYINEAGLKEKINLHIGSALNIIPTLNETFDLVFIDADKENYSNYYDLVFPKLRPGGFILADNVLWSGKVLEDESNMDVDTKALHDFNKKISEDKRVEKLLLPLRDGVMMVRKLKVLP